ncbi:DEAD/DEAH box helicase [Microbacterium sp. Clip185]|uniref:DEAD/DEAH box helicase n=1 Tax=Microbacterium sp. Clip185 TaxID=3025663 RepID=UPI0023667412|nr:DEAD/DEAH box helicase [Microbacterium sp. Clip185]WDG17045.1 DEAD/DEAH box helicase [Microbacterium sp. Clip185]
MTAAIIAAAPRLSNVDAERLPTAITDAYLKVTMARSLVRNDLVANDEVFGELRSIGAAQEAIALNQEPGDVRASAAYVAASAYRILADADAGRPNDDRHLTPGTVGPRIASMMLYLVADAPADASEVADGIDGVEQEQFSDLVASLKRLGKGEINGAESSEEPFQLDLDADPLTIGAVIGYRKCARSLADLVRLLRTPDPAADPLAGQFASIATAMSMSVDFNIGDRAHVSSNLIAGPWHLARLLEMASPVLVAASTASLPAPSGISAEDWQRVTARTARLRPLLWRNHRQALDAGLLEPGVSAVLAFPTGAGKSTMSELKVGATILRGLNVICLAPTLSLIDQLARSFKLAVPGARVLAQRDADEEIESASDGVPEIFVMTPESCLAALGTDQTRFGEVGLVLFDEAHLMHVEGDAPNRRALDASLCFLTLVSRFGDADLMLVSAMFANSQELADWLKFVTGRPAIALDTPWKPTRQARGALVYPLHEVERLRKLRDEMYRTSTTDGPPAALKQQLLAQPHGFFSLKSTWESTQTRDYRLMPLLESQVTLGVSGSRTRDRAWRLTANANRVAARLAQAAADGGLKTLVFTHQVGWTSSIARLVTTAQPNTTPLLRSEQRLLARSVELLGAESALYLKLEDGAVVGSAIPHHGLLLPDERRLHELLFRRPDGVPVLVATSTVTQGMNFPSEFVIIAGDRRFDASANGRIRLEAHELLNAAGRAGRAGSHANALVLAIPSEIVDYDGATRIGSGWAALRTAFSQSDQCVTVRDPIGALLDAMEEETEPPLLRYLGRRVDSVTDPVIGPGMLRQSFAAFSAKTAGKPDWIERRLEQLSGLFADDSVEDWLRQCALVSGLPLDDVSYLADQLSTQTTTEWDHIGWSEWMLDLLRDRPSMVVEVLRVGSRAAMSGAPDDLGEWDTDNLIDHVRACLAPWMRGANLTQIQEVGISRGLARGDQHLEFARKFVLRVVPDLAYLFTLPSLVRSEQAKLGLAEPLPDDHPLTTLSRCVELGVDSAEKVHVLELAPRTTRAQVHGS